MGQVNPHPFFPWKEENSAIHEQLKSFFILQNILKISKGTLCQFLRENSGETNPDIWSQVQVCVTCDILVHQYYEVFTQKPTLESDLERIEGELKTKIHESKADEGGQRASSFWGMIRSQLITGVVEDDEGSADEYPQVKLEFTDIPDFKSDEEELSSGALQVKIEDVDSISTPLSYSDDEEEYDLGETHVKIEVLDSVPTTLPISEGSGSSFLYICAHCPYKTYYSPHYELHLQAHLEGASSSCCPDCGVYVLKEKIAKHRYRHSLQAKMKIARLAAKESQAAKKKSGKVPPPPYSTIKEKGTNKIYQQCRHCPYKISDNSTKNIEAHILLHQRDSGAIPCPDCGSYQKSTALAHHRAKNHSLPRSIRRVTPYKKEGAEHECSKCPYRNMQKAMLKAHMEVHEEGSEALPCKDCGVYILPRKMEKHLLYCDKGIPDHSLVERRTATRNRNTKKMRDVDASNPNFFSYRRGKMPHKMYQCRHCDFRIIRNVAEMETHVEEMHGKVEDSVGISEPEVEATSSSQLEIKVEEPSEVGADDDDYLESVELKPEVDVGETVIKTEVVDLGHFSVPNFSMFEEEEGESEPVPVPVASQTFEPASSSSDFYHNCPYCPFKHNTTRYFENHMPVHARGSNAVACPDCGVYIFPDNLVVHRKLDLRRALTLLKPPRRKSVLPRKIVKKTKKKKKEEIPTPNPDYSSHKQEGKRPGLVYSCNHCPFTMKSDRKKIEAHVKLHEPGSRAIPCTFGCGFYVFPENMNMHLAHRHPEHFRKPRKPKRSKR